MNKPSQTCGTKLNDLTFVSQESQKERGKKKKEEIIAKNFLSTAKNINIQNKTKNSVTPKNSKSKETYTQTYNNQTAFLTNKKLKTWTKGKKF